MGRTAVRSPVFFSSNNKRGVGGKFGIETVAVPPDGTATRSLREEQV